MTEQPTEPTQDVDVDVTVTGQDDEQPELPEVPDEPPTPEQIAAHEVDDPEHRRLHQEQGEAADDEQPAHHDDTDG